MPLHPLLLGLSARDTLSKEEQRIIEQGLTPPRLVKAKTDLVCEGDSPAASILLLDGVAARYHLLADGRRQISAIHINGDFVDLHSFLLGRMDHSVCTVIDCTVATMPHEYLKQITEQHPHLARLLWLATIIDAATHRRWLMISGRLSAAGRIAHFLCEMYERMRTVKLTDGLRFRLPISQSELSDAMGLSSVHVNRSLQELRRQGLIVWQGGDVEILDLPALQEMAEFDPTYLNLEIQPR